jgi:anti-sigma B factor antagonist
MTDEPLDVQTEAIADGHLLKPVGDIDLGKAPAFRRHISQVQSSRPSRLVIDLSEVPYMDSSGVATLVEAMQIARRQSGKLVLFGLQARVRSIFEIARLDTIFKICDSRESALGA